MPVPRRSLATPARVLIADDSVFMRHALQRLLEQHPGITVVGTAGDGIEAVQKALELRPDVITMDVEMPKMDGIRAVGEIMQTVPTPIVMVSTLTAAGADTAIRALEAGAVECVGKPSGLSHDLAAVGDALGEAVLRASEARVQRRQPMSPLMAPHSGAGAPAGAAATSIAVIGSSTGGPPALNQVVPKLPGNLAAGVLVIQHMPPGFTTALARRLDSLSPLAVREAAEGDLVTNGQVLVAPGGSHLIVGRDRRVHITNDPPVHGVRPAVDVTLASVAPVFGRHTTVAILTGMGRDGAQGAVQVERLGGSVIVQDEASCVVYGMPRVAKESTQHAREVPLAGVADALMRAVAVA